MKKIAVTVAVLALGLAACQPKAEDNAVGNEANVEDAANADVNAATNSPAINHMRRPYCRPTSSTMASVSA